MKRKFLNVSAIAALCFGMAACSNSTNDKAANDSTANSTTTNTTTVSSSGHYAAKAQTIETESKQGYYLNPKTGKPYTSLRMDTTTGRVTTETGEPVWRYVDKRTWQVYGGTNWDTVGHAKMEGDKLMYEDHNDKWVDYDTRWKSEDESMNNSSTNMNDSSGNNQNMNSDQNMNQKTKTKTKTNDKGETKTKTKNE